MHLSCSRLICFNPQYHIMSSEHCQEWSLSPEYSRVWRPQTKIKWKGHKRLCIMKQLLICICPIVNMEESHWLFSQKFSIFFIFLNIFQIDTQNSLVSYFNHNKFHQSTVYYVTNEEHKLFINLKYLFLFWGHSHCNQGW